MITQPKGGYKAEWIGDTDQPVMPNIVTWTSFRNHWKKHYPFLKVSNKREDVCNYCYVVAQATKYNFAAAQIDEVSLGSMAEDVLCKECDDEDEREFEDDQSLPSLGSVESSGGNQSADPVVGVEIGFDVDDHVTKEKRTKAITIVEFKKAVRHVVSAKAQRKYLNMAIKEALAHLKLNAPHAERHYVFICDYAQNMSYPSLPDEQAGETYYLTPLSVYVFGMVDAAHLYDGVMGVEDGEHMDAHIYKEAMGAKGGNNVASLILRSLKRKGLLQPGNKGGKLSLFFDNCVGQNKNNCVIHLAPLLVEAGFFSEVEICFLIVGHTKNSCDRIFNSLKKKTRKATIWTYEQLLRAVDDSHLVTVLDSNPEDFLQVEKYEKQYYRNLVGEVTKNHIFSVKEEDISTGVSGKVEVTMTIKEADIPDAVVKTFNCSARNRPTTKPDLVFPEPLEQLPAQKLNPWMRCHFYKKWRHVVPQKHWDEVCPEPSKEDLAATVDEKQRRAALRKWKKEGNAAVVAAAVGDVYGEDGGGKLPAEEEAGESQAAFGDKGGDSEADATRLPPIHLPEASM